MQEQIADLCLAALEAGWLAEIIKGALTVAGWQTLVVAARAAARHLRRGPAAPEAEPEPSPALRNFLASLGSDSAEYDAKQRHLCCPGALAAFHANGLVYEILTDDARLHDLLPGGEFGPEMERAKEAACARRDAVIERDRAAANERAAARMAEARREKSQPAARPQIPGLPAAAAAGCVVSLISDGAGGWTPAGYADPQRPAGKGER